MPNPSAARPKQYRGPGASCPWKTSPFAQIRHHNALPRRQGPAVEHLSVQRAEVDALPAGLDALVATSDLQGRGITASDDDPPLLGEVLAEWWATSAQQGLVPDPARTGMLLCGDLWAHPASINAAGRATSVPYGRPCPGPSDGSQASWATTTCSTSARTAASDHLRRAPFSANAHVLDGTVCDVDGLRVAGVSGLIGDPRLLHRRESPAYRALLERLIDVAGPAAPPRTSPAGRGSTRECRPW